jgi:hypothetical protein
MLCDGGFQSTTFLYILISQVEMNDRSNTIHLVTSLPECVYHCMKTSDYGRLRANHTISPVDPKLEWGVVVARAVRRCPAEG